MFFVLKVCSLLALVTLVRSLDDWNNIVRTVRSESQVNIGNTSVMTWRVELESTHQHDLSRKLKVVRNVNCFMERTDAANKVALIALYNRETATGFHIASFIPEAGLMHRLTTQKKDEIYAQEFTIRLAKVQATDTSCKYYCRVLWSYGRDGSIYVSRDIGLTLLVVDPVKKVLELPPPNTTSNVGRWGDFGEVKRCPTGQYIDQFQLLWMDTDRCLFKCNDETRIRGFNVRCSGAVKELSTPAYNHDSVADWPYKQCPGSSTYANAVSYQYQRQQGVIGDDTSGAELLMTCDDGTTIGNIGKNDASLGDWYTAQCPGQSKLCGFQAQVEQFSYLRDNTALNVLRFYCCD